MFARLQIFLGLFFFCSIGWGEDSGFKLTPEAIKALRNLKLPGIQLNLDERSIDVNATVCLHKGLLELVACTKGSKEHESIISIEARPVHIHTALLLFGAKPGTPTLRRAAGADGVRWIPVEPAGDRVHVSLVFPDAKGKLQEHSIEKFIALAQPKKISGLKEDKAPPRKFPSSFLFAGSHLVADGAGPKKYLCEQSGNVISISSFGDELLCLPEVFGHKNDGLIWEVNSKGLPKIGQQVILRLRPNPKAPRK